MQPSLAACTCGQFTIKYLTLVWCAVAATAVWCTNHSTPRNTRKNQEIGYTNTQTHHKPIKRKTCSLGTNICNKIFSQKSEKKKRSMLHRVSTKFTVKTGRDMTLSIIWYASLGPTKFPHTLWYLSQRDGLRVCVHTAENKSQFRKSASSYAQQKQDSSLKQRTWETTSMPPFNIHATPTHFVSSRGNGVPQTTGNTEQNVPTTKNKHT